MFLKKTILTAAIVAIAGGVSCSSGKKAESATAPESTPEVTRKVTFDADSALAYVKMQTDEGPRTPGSEAHARTGKKLIDELKRHGATVIEQRAPVTYYDGYAAEALNILGRFNPQAQDRILLLAHWDTRPWADMDPDVSNRAKPVEGANDGASGVAVLLEIARSLGLQAQDKGIDILFVDAEDRGTYNNEDSWALGARHFARNLPIEGYAPQCVILLDMVGGKDATFAREYFSMEADPMLVNEIWQIAQASGYGNYFVDEQGGAITDDHVEFIKQGIPAINIIQYDAASETGFYPYWHTTGDTADKIDKKTLEAVGQTLLNYIYR